MSAVTWGLPSRSPPTHDPSRRYGRRHGGRHAVVADRAPRSRDTAAAPGGTGLVEDRHRGADLVERVELLPAEQRRPPQRRDLLAQPAIGVRALAVADARVVAAVELVGDAVERGDNGSAARLGRVRGEAPDAARGRAAPSRRRSTPRAATAPATESARWGRRRRDPARAAPAPGAVPRRGSPGGTGR